MQEAPRPRARTLPAAQAQSGSRRGRARPQAGRSWRQRSLMTGTTWRSAEGTGGCMCGTPAATSTSRCASTCLCGPRNCTAEGLHRALVGTASVPDWQVHVWDSHIEHSIQVWLDLPTCAQCMCLLPCSRCPGLPSCLLVHCLPSWETCRAFSTMQTSSDG